MKRIVKLAFACAALTAALVSCRKEGKADLQIDGMTPITFSATMADEADYDSDGSKISLGEKSVDGLTTIMKWENTDNLQLYTWNTPSVDLHDNGCFTIQKIDEVPDDHGNVYTQATFTGYALNAALNDTKGCAVVPYVANRDITTDANPKITVDIPTVQDGTGVKYIVACAKTKPEVFGNPLVIGAFFVCNSFIKINIPTSYRSARIASIKLELESLGSVAASAFLAGDGCYVQPTSNMSVMGGNSKVITVQKESGFFTGGDVFFATRVLTNANFFPIVFHITLTNRDGEVATIKTGQLGSSSKTVKNGYICDLGTIPEDLEFAEPSAPHVHSLQKVNGQPATETTAGWKDYYECVADYKPCGLYFEDEAGSVRIGDATALAAWKAVGGNGYIAPTGGDSDLPAGDLVMNLNFTKYENTLMYTKDDTGAHVALPTSASAVASTIYYTQDGTEYTFAVGGGGVSWYYFSKTSTNNICKGFFLGNGRTWLKLPVVSGYRLEKIGAWNCQDGTVDKKIYITPTEGDTAVGLTDGVELTAPIAKNGVLGYADVSSISSATAPLYIYGRNDNNVTASSGYYKNTVALGRIVLVYNKVK